MKSKGIILTAVLTALALISFAIEGAFAPVTPIYGIKLGVANIFTLFALYALGARRAGEVLILRIILGAIFAGQAVSFIYSLCGGALSFLIMILLKRFFSEKQMWVLSALCAVAHNLGQISAAVFITRTWQIFCYFPVLLISGIISGVITGLCAQLVLARLRKTKLLDDIN